MSKAKSMKGFFFVLISFILITYVLLSTSAWVRAIETSERSYSDAFRAYTLTVVADQVSEDRISEYADVASHFALYKLVNHSISHELLEKEEDEVYHIKQAYLELLSNCSASPGHFADGVPASYEGNERSYCFAGFLSSLNSSLSTTGFEVSSFSVSGLSFNETGHPLHYIVNMTVSLSMKDLQTNTSLTRTYTFSKTVDAEGMVDPLIARESIENLKGTGPQENLTLYKGIYLYPGEVGDMYPEVLGSGSAGQGWFYGPVVLWDDDVAPQDRKHAILVGNYTDIISNPRYKEFGAYVLLNEPETSSGSCGKEEFSTFNPVRYEDDCDVESGEFSKPFIVYEDFMEDVYDEMKDTNYKEPGHYGKEARILFVSDFEPSEVMSHPERKDDENPLVYNIEPFRDYVRCSYYIVNEEAPSFLQRMLEDGYSRSSPLGIETTLVGKYAGGSYNMDLYDDRSRVDREFFMDVGGIMVRGLPGCKSQPMCVDPRSYVGHFALSMDSMEFYFGISDKEDEENIGCNDGKASCETE
jgi:hypothetical protein